MNSAENVSDEELGRFIRRASLKRFSFAQEAYRIAIALQALRSPPTEDGDRVERLIAQAYVRGVEWRDENPGHVDLAYRFKAACDYADKTVAALSKDTPDE